ncbi:MAG: hypothetical protein NT150_06370 [Bacteroidetes bacterium]|nr:hypothetical protein [Bacteroidota bacterium]
MKSILSFAIAAIVMSTVFIGCSSSRESADESFEKGYWDKAIKEYKKEIPKELEEKQ